MPPLYSPLIPHYEQNVTLLRLDDSFKVNWMVNHSLNDRNSLHHDTPSCRHQEFPNTVPFVLYAFHCIVLASAPDNESIKKSDKLWSKMNKLILSVAETSLSLVLR